MPVPTHVYVYTHAQNGRLFGAFRIIYVVCISRIASGHNVTCIPVNMAQSIVCMAQSIVCVAQSIVCMAQSIVCVAQSIVCVAQSIVCVHGDMCTLLIPGDVTGSF